MLLLLLLIRLLVADAADPAVASPSSFDRSHTIAATLLLPATLFSATHFAIVKLSYWLASTPVLHSNWFKLVWLAAAAASAAPS